MVKIGDKIAMEGERQRYTVQACNERFAIMTKPFNAKRTYIYSITDLSRRVRGRCNLIFGAPFRLDNAEGAAQAMAMIESGEMEVSYRHYKPLADSEIKQLI